MWMEAAAARYEGWLQVYCIHMCGLLTEGNPQAWGIGHRVNNSP